eukprot:s112_g50.t1
MMHNLGCNEQQISCSTRSEGEAVKAVEAVEAVEATAEATGSLKSCPGQLPVFFVHVSWRQLRLFWPGSCRSSDELRYLTAKAQAKSQAF